MSALRTVLLLALAPLHRSSLSNTHTAKYQTSQKGGRAQERTRQPRCTKLCKYHAKLSFVFGTLDFSFKPLWCGVFFCPAVVPACLFSSSCPLLFSSLSPLLDVLILLAVLLFYLLRFLCCLRCSFSNPHTAKTKPSDGLKAQKKRKKGNRGVTTLIERLIDALVDWLTD